MALDLDHVRQLSEQLQHEDGRAFLSDALHAADYVREHLFDGSVNEYLQQAARDRRSNEVFLACVFHELLRNCEQQ